MKVTFEIEFKPGTEIDPHLLDSLRDHLLEYRMRGAPVEEPVKEVTILED